MRQTIDIIVPETKLLLNPEKINNLISGLTAGAVKG